MVRFKVIKGSHLLLGAAVILLIAVIAVILLQGGMNEANENDASAIVTTVDHEIASEGAKAISAFASNTLKPNSLRIEIIPDTTVLPEEDKPRILIYHTHTHEAYEQNSKEPYEAIESWRTLDEKFSVVRVGSALADVLTGLGCTVVHDVTDHEQDSLSSAYERSAQTLEKYAADGELFDLYIDLHRDAYVDGLDLHTEHEGAQYAQLMLLVGRGDAYEGIQKPDYEKNLAFAQRLTSELNTIIPGICRNVTVKQGRYNQHFQGQGILVEVGHNLNSLEQALASVPCLGRALVSVIEKYGENQRL